MAETADFWKKKRPNMAGITHSAGFGDGSARTVKTRMALPGVLFVQPLTNNGQTPITMHQPFGIYIKIHLYDQARGKRERVSKRRHTNSTPIIWLKELFYILLQYKINIPITINQNC